MYRELRDALLLIAEKAIDALQEANGLTELMILRRYLNEAIWKVQGRKGE